MTQTKPKPEPSALLPLSKRLAGCRQGKPKEIGKVFSGFQKYLYGTAA